MTLFLMFVGAWLLLVSGVCAVLCRSGVRARDRQAGA